MRLAMREKNKEEEKVIKIRDTGDNNSEEVVITRSSPSSASPDDEQREEKKKGEADSGKKLVKR